MYIRCDVMINVRLCMNPKWVVACYPVILPLWEDLFWGTKKVPQDDRIIDSTCTEITVP